jgi:hypothetical protein
VRVASVLIAVHRPAEYDQTVVPGDIRAGIGLTAEIDVADTETGRPQQRVEVAEYFVGHVLKDQ